MLVPILLLTMLTLLASSVGTLTGFGTSTIMVPILLLRYPLPETLLFVGIIHWFGDIWKMMFFKRGVRWNLILGFGVPGIIASYLGASLSLNVAENILSRILGAFFLLYVTFLFLNPQWQLPEKQRFTVVGGLLSGFFAGIFGVGGAIRSTFLSAFDPTKAVYIFTAGAIGFVIDTTRIATYLTGGTKLQHIPIPNVALALAIPTSLLGAFLAKKIVDRIPQDSFRKIIAIFLGIVALKFLLFP